MVDSLSIAGYESDIASTMIATDENMIQYMEFLNALKSMYNYPNLVTNP